MPRLFPQLTPQSYLPGGFGGGNLYPPNFPGAGGTGFPPLGPNSYLPAPGTLDPPIMNFSNGPRILPAPSGFPSMMPSMMPPQTGFPPPTGLPPPMPFGNPNGMSMMGQPPPPYYDPGMRSGSRRRPVRICRRRRSRRCRPVIRIVDSSSCSSSSSCTSRSSCSRRRRRSRSCSRRQGGATQQQQQPIILLPIQYQQPSGALSGSAPNQLQQSQPQQIMLPPIQIQQQQPGQFQQQSLNMPHIQIQPLNGQFQQQQHQQLALPPIQLNSSTLMPSSSSMMVGAGQSLIPPSMSLPQLINLAQSQQLPSGAIQYVQSMPQSSSPLQYVSAERRSTNAPSRVLVNSTNKKSSTATKALPRSSSLRTVPQMDLKYGRRPFDWYGSEKKNNVIDENVRVGQRGAGTVVSG